MGVYHINHINALHSKLKLWMKRKYGIATKYIGNYRYADLILNGDPETYLKPVTEYKNPD